VIVSAPAKEPDATFAERAGLGALEGILACG
jgi:hypothetical protein